ncbi:MAG TPA: alkaline phosphatase family protein [Candidatus Angelobacter sp.]
MGARHIELAVKIVVSLQTLFLALFAAAQVPRSSHVVLVIDENTSYNTTAAQMPWLVKEGSAYGHAMDYVSNTSGSLMDYLWLASGSCHSTNCVLPSGTHNFGCTGNACAGAITDDNIFREMNNRGISWRVYAQSYAAAGGKVTSPDRANGTHYYRRHNGATWYSDILGNVAGSQARIVDFSRFAVDLANNALPQFSIIAPDGLHDGHDAPASAADVFLNTTLTPLLAKPYFQPGGDGLLIVTFDNGDGDAAGLVYTAVIGPQVTPRTVSRTPYRHENTLRTLLDALGITTHPGLSASATSMKDFFSAGSISVASPVQNATTGTQVLVSASATEPNAQVYQIQVWDQTTGTKLGQSAPGTSTINQTYSLATGAHQLIVEDICTNTFQALHKALVNITVGGADGVTIASPVSNSTTGTQVQVSASATESSAQIYQLQVWDNSTGQKLGESPAGTSTVSQTFSLAPGTHQIVVEDISTGSFQALHKSSATINVATSNGVTVLSPVNSSTVSGPVLVSAFANSSTTIDHLEVWDEATDTKLGDSPGTAVNTIYTLPPGQHTIVVRAVDSDSQVVSKSQASVGVN